VVGVALIGFDRSGNLYVTNMPVNAIREFSRKGVDLGNFATTGLNAPAGVTFDKRGNLYVSNRGDNTIRVFSPIGEDRGYFATTGMVGPVGLAFSPEPEDNNELEGGGIALLVGPWSGARALAPPAAPRDQIILEPSRVAVSESDRPLGSLSRSMSEVAGTCCGPRSPTVARRGDRRRSRGGATVSVGATQVRLAALLQSSVPCGPQLVRHDLQRRGGHSSSGLGCCRFRPQPSRFLVLDPTREGWRYGTACRGWRGACHVRLDPGARRGHVGRFRSSGGSDQPHNRPQPARRTLASDAAHVGCGRPHATGSMLSERVYRLDDADDARAVAMLILQASSSVAVESAGPSSSDKPRATAGRPDAPARVAGRLVAGRVGAPAQGRRVEAPSSPRPVRAGRRAAQTSSRGRGGSRCRIEREQTVRRPNGRGQSCSAQERR